MVGLRDLVIEFHEFRPDAVPLNSRLAMVRVESLAYSMLDAGIPFTRPTQRGGWVGCVYTIALRRFSSSNTRANAGIAQILAEAAAMIRHHSHSDSLRSRAGS